MTCATSHRAYRDRVRKAVALACVAGVSGASIHAQPRYHSECRIMDGTHLKHFGGKGQPAELSHFTCRISGGPLDGFVVNGTNIWELDTAQATLIGSLAVAQKATSTLVYEVQHVVRKEQVVRGRVIGRQGISHGIFKAGTGSALPLVGKTFTSVARQSGPGRFSIDTIVDSSATAPPITEEGQL